MVRLRTIVTRTILVPVLIVGALLSPLLVGIEPVGSDPDLMYRPINHELARGEFPSGSITSVWVCPW